MTAREIRKQVPPMAIWMADAAICAARRAITGHTRWDWELNCYPSNRPEVDTAVAVLYGMFDGLPAHIQGALMAMPEEMDGCLSFPDKDYFDAFVTALDRRIREAFAAVGHEDDPDCLREALPRQAD